MKAGYNNGLANGTASASTGVITSSAAAANHTAGKNTTAIGYADSADGQGVNTTLNTIELHPATPSMATPIFRSHQESAAADLQILLAFLNRTGSWDQADFNYDGQVNSADLQDELFTLNTNLGNQGHPCGRGARSGGRNARNAGRGARNGDHPAGAGRFPAEAVVPAARVAQIPRARGRHGVPRSPPYAPAAGQAAPLLNVGRRTDLVPCGSVRSNQFMRKS